MKVLIYNEYRHELDPNCRAHTIYPEGMHAAIAAFLEKHPSPSLVICDSQVFGKVAAATPEDVRLTSFSILMARHKGVLTQSVRGVDALDGLCEGDRVLISEGCTHHRQCDDIGTVKLPRMITKHAGVDVKFEYTSGGSFPEDLTGYAAVVHCGGCMLNGREMASRMRRCAEQNVPFTNYGVAIAHMNGILKRSVRPIPELAADK